MSPVDPVVSSTLRSVLALLLLAGAWHKLREPGPFSEVLMAYGLGPAALARTAATLVPAMELLLAGGLWLSPWPSKAALATGVLFLLYAAMMAASLLQGRRLADCGCRTMGAGSRLRPALLLRNAGLVLVALLAAVPSSDRIIGWIDLVSITAAAACLLALYATAEDLLALSGQEV